MRSMHTKCWTIPTVLTLAVLAALLCIVPAHARDYDTAVTVAMGEQFTLAETETIGGALVVTGGDATVLGRVKKDVIVVDGTATLGPTARVDGSVLTVRGTVERDELAQVLGEQRQLSASEFAEIMSGVGAATEESPDAGKEMPDAAEAAEEQAPAEDETPAHAEEAVEAPDAAAEEEEAAPAAETEADEEQRVERGDRSGFGNDINIRGDEVRVGDVASFGGAIRIWGTVRGDVASFGGPVTVWGTVEGDIATFGGAVKLEDGSRVTGDIATFGAAVTKDPGAVHEGKVAGFGEGLPHWIGTNRSPTQSRGWLGGTIFALVVGLLIAVIFPNSTRTIADSVTAEPGRAAGHGALTLLLVLPVCVILALTCIGLVLVPVVLLGCLAAGILGGVGVEALIGRWISRRLGWAVTSVVALVAIGVVALQLVGLTQFVPPLVIVHALASFAVLIFGLGGAVMTGFGTRPDSTWITGRFNRGDHGEEAPAVDAPPTADTVPAAAGPVAAAADEIEADEPGLEEPEQGDESAWAPSSAEAEAEVDEDPEDHTPPDDLPAF